MKPWKCSESWTTWTESSVWCELSQLALSRCESALAWVSCAQLISFGILHLPGQITPDPETPKISKTQKSDSEVTFGAPAKETQKLLTMVAKIITPDKCFIFN